MFKPKRVKKNHSENINYKETKRNGSNMEERIDLLQTNPRIEYQERE